MVLTEVEIEHCIQSVAVCLEESLEIWPESVDSVCRAPSALNILSPGEETLDQKLFKSDSRNVLGQVLLNVMIDLLFSQLTIDALHGIIFETWVRYYVLPNKVRGAL